MYLKKENIKVQNRKDKKREREKRTCDNVTPQRTAKG